MATCSRTTSNDFIYEELMNGIEQLFRCDRIRYSTWMQLYTYIFDLCVDKQQETAHTTYSKIQEHLKTIHQKELVFDEKNVIGDYLDHRQRFFRSSRIFNGICRYLTRTLSSREGRLDDGTYRNTMISQMCSKIWNENIFPTFYESVTKSCLDLIRLEREQQQSTDRSQIAAVVHSYVDSSFDVYQRHFENPFLTETEEFYRNESTILLKQSSIIDYLKKVSQYLNEEIDRAQSYMDDSTRSKLIETMVRVMIHDHLPSISDQTKSLLYRENDQEFKELFQVLVCLPNGYRTLQMIVEDVLNQTSCETIDSIINDNFEVYIKMIYDLYLKHFQLIQRRFPDDPAFLAVLDRACARFVNNNSITKAFKNPMKLPEELAQFCDKLLRKNEKQLEETEMETNLKQIELFLRYLNDKDVFGKFYQKMLAQRLVHRLSSSDDNERLLITIIHRTCDFQYANKLEKMLRDVQTSQTIIQEFDRYRSVRHSSPTSSNLASVVQFSALILSANEWIFSKSVNLFLPDELQPIHQSFVEFYKTRHNNRRLIWLHQYSRGELQTFYTRQKYTLKASIYQMAVLLLFNQSLGWTIEQIQEKTQLDRDLLFKISKNLLEHRLLTCPEDMDQNPNALLRLAADFRSDKTRIDITLKLKSVEEITSDPMHQRIEEDRILVIRATIVRIMKTHRQLNQSRLISEVIENVKSRFTTEHASIEKSIDMLVESEYLIRHSTDPNILCYVP